MRFDGSLRFRGEVEWLTPENGGRVSGPPLTPLDHDYAATAYVPPAGLDDGLASFVLRVVDRSAWRSEANGDWLIIENEGLHWIDEGSVVVITEGARPVARFYVHQALSAQ